MVRFSGRNAEGQKRKQRETKERTSSVLEIQIWENVISFSGLLISARKQHCSGVLANSKQKRPTVHETERESGE